MKQLRLCLFIFCTYFTASLTGASNDYKDRMLCDLDTIRSIFQTQYAPTEWKKRHHDWDLDREIDLAKTKVAANEIKTIKAYQQALRSVFHSTHDYHVGVHFFSTESANLPLCVRGTNGKYFITFIDRTRLPERSFPFKIGDELVQFGGRPTHEVVQELKQSETSNTDSPTDQALAERCLTMRAGTAGTTVPRGPVTIAVRSGTSVSRYQIMWEYTPEKVKDLMALEPMGASTEFSHSLFRNNPLFARQLMGCQFQTEIQQPRLNNDPNEIGSRESFVPALGKKIWESDPSSHFHAYIFVSPSGRPVGYVRIPHYVGDEEEIAQFAQIISHLQARTDALVVDQVNNPGGMVFYCYALTSMLTDQPLFTPRHRMAVTQQDVYYALEALTSLTQMKSDEDAQKILGDSICGYPVDYQTGLFIVGYLRFIVDEWTAGHTLTHPYYLFGVDYINPNPAAHYTKPIVVLINELDFSGGDFFPAILQDNQRVTLFGTRTAGAGGYVLGHNHPNVFGVAGISYTASIAERIDNSPIENLGVTPDVPYALTAEDLQHNYAGYVKAVLNTVETALKR